MIFDRIRLWSTCFAVVFATVSLSGTAVVGQIIGAAPAGVVVDPQGVLRVKQYADPTGELTRQRIAQMRAALAPELARPSKLRKISLTRLEAAIADNIRRGVGLTDDMKYLAGLTQLRYVYCYPETRDIVIAGPAEGYVNDLSGRVVGMSTGRSILELEDLIVALRCFPASGDLTRMIGCSIDPSPEGLQRMQQFLVDISGRVRPNDGERIAAGLKESLGEHKVSVQGISPKTHFAQVLVEADYRMKLIGIGLESPPVRMQTFISKARPSDVSRNALQRWYFVPDYDSVRVSEDGLAMELVGEGVKLISENEMVAADGGRAQSGHVDRASQAFARSFTENYSEIAKHSPIYAQLRNLIDMSVAAAYIQQEGFYDQVNWSMELFANEEQLGVENYAAPLTVESAVNVVWKGNTLMTPIGGGVSIEPTEAIEPSRVKQEERGELTKARQSSGIEGLPAGAWWWD